MASERIPVLVRITIKSGEGTEQIRHCAMVACTVEKYDPASVPLAVWEVCLEKLREWARRQCADVTDWTVCIPELSINFPRDEEEEAGDG